MIYLIASNSYHLISFEINKIYKNLNDVEVYDFSSTSLEELIDNAGYSSLFNEEKKILVRNCDFFGTKSTINTDILDHYLSNPNPLVTIIFTYNGSVDERKKVVKLIKEKFKLIIIKPLTYKDSINQIIKYCESNKFRISYDNANYLINKCLNNLDIAFMELEKIFLFYNKPFTINKTDIENLIANQMNDNNFKFVDAVIEKNIDISLKLLNDFKIQKVEPVALISLLAREYRNMLIILGLKKNGITDEEIARQLKLQSWQLDKYLKNCYIYKITDLEKILLKLCELDYQIKTDFVDKYLAMELYIIKEQ